jgi:hypothetical protein
MAGALDGIRVIDFGRYLAGPLAALLLADQLRCKRPLAGLASAKPALKSTGHAIVEAAGGSDT